jgi:hypothetical protein
MVVSEMDCYFKGFNSCTEEEAWYFYDHANQLRSYFTSSHKIYDTLVVVE